MTRIMIIDGYGLIFRAFHALPPLTHEGASVGALYGWLTAVHKIRQAHPSDAVVVALDGGGPGFREAMYPLYKSHREAPPEPLREQLPKMEGMIEALGLPSIRVQGYEADDIIATIVHRYAQTHDCMIVSSDKDLLALLAVSPRVSCWDPLKDREITASSVEEKWGILPAQLPDWLSLVGDRADYIPGWPGVGAKTATRWLQLFGSLQGIWDHREELSPPRFRASIGEHWPEVELSASLVRLCPDVPLPSLLEDWASRPYAPERLVPWLKSHGFESLVKRWFPTSLPLGLVAMPDSSREEAASLIAEAPALEIEAFDNIAAWEGWIRIRIAQASTMILSIVVPSKGKDPQVVCLDSREDRGWRWPAGLSQEDFGLWSEGLLACLRAPAVTVITDQLGRGLRLLDRASGRPLSWTSLHQCHDLGILAHVLDPTHSDPEGAAWFEARERSSLRAPEQAMASWFGWWERLRRACFERGLWSSYWQEEAPLVTVLVAMEQAGVRIDPAMLEGLTAEWMASEARLEAQIIDLAGESFNVGSPKQWGEILQKQPGVRLTRKTKQGSFGTSADILEDLADEGVEIARLGLEWRQLRKLSSTYGRPLVEHADPVTHRLHSQLSQSSTATGRLSSSHPNLQNLPVRSGEGRAIRRAIVASPGTCLLAADYSQIELRILAYVARIPSMMEALRRGEDLHRQTASALYRIAVDEVSEVQRRVAKTVNFGIIYGITAFGLAKQLKVERSEAQWLIDRTAELYPELRVYQERVLEEAHRTGWVRSVDGRRHGFRVDHRTAHHARQFAERSLINATIQGVAATWMKRAMIALDAGLRAQPELGARMVLQIHDELLFEVAEDRVMPLAKLVDGAMRNVTREDIPLVVDLRVGSDWGSATPWLLSTD